VRPGTDRAPAEHARNLPAGSRPAVEHLTATPQRAAGDGRPGDDGRPVSGAEASASGPGSHDPPRDGGAADAPPEDTAAAEVPPAAAPAHPPAGDDSAAASPPRDIWVDDSIPVVSVIDAGGAAPVSSPAVASTRAGPPHAASAQASSPQAIPASPSDAQPSWPDVIATTLRLWLQRRLGRGRERRAGAGRPGARRRAAILGAVVVVFAAGGLTVTLAQHQDAAPRAARGAQPAGLSPEAVAAAAANRQAAATWVAAQVSHSVVVSCDPVMCGTLQADGFPAGDVLSITASANDPLGSAVVVSTTALRSQFGRRLPDVYAPVVLAAFGTGDARVDVRVEAPEGGRAYLVSQRADLLARQASGQQLLANKALHTSAAAAQDMAAGNLDSRLLITLATLAAQVHVVNVVAVGDSGPGASAGVPLRMAQISAAVSPGQPNRNASYLAAVLAFLKAQQPPFLASYSVVQAGGPVIQIEFAAPSPLGLLGARATS
jgi:hypothetical protein